MSNQNKYIPHIVEFTPDQLINGRYRVIRLLGRGSKTPAYLVNDQINNDNNVVLKVLPMSLMKSSGQDTLSQELSILTRMQHPNLVRVYGYGKLDKAPAHFITMEYIRGDRLRKVAQSISAGEFTGLTIQILKALEYLHSGGVIHGDLKEENILVTQDAYGCNTIKLMDYGLVKHFKNAIEIGALEYIAPERFSGAPPSPEVDLYAFGVLMYKCLTGTFPFTGTPQEITRGHLHRIPKRPSQRNAQIPKIWDVIVARLLAKDPSDRYHFCRDVQADLERRNNPRVQDHGLLCASIWETYLATKNADMDRVVHNVLMVTGNISKGKTEQLIRLHVLSGDEGCGKNQIMNQIIHCLQAENIDVFEASCNPTLEAPYQPILNAFSTHSLLFKNLSLLVRQESLKKSQPANVNNNKNKQTTIDFKRYPDLVSYRLREAIGKQVADVAKVTPIVLVLRDIEFADVNTLELVFFLCRILQEEHFVVLLTVNMNRLSKCIRREYENQKIVIGKTVELNFNPLSQKEIETQINSALQNPQVPERFFDELHQHSGGNLLFIGEVVADLVRKGILSRIQDTWTLSKDFDWHVVVSVGRVELLRSKIKSLNHSERNVVNVMSVSGVPMNEAALARFLNLQPHILNTVLNGLLQNQILERRISGENVAYAFVNRSMQDEIYRTIPQHEREKIHRTIAHDLQSQKKRSNRISTEQLAHHFLNGKEIKQAFIYTSLALVNMRRVHCLNQAMRLCELAEAAFSSEAFRHRRSILHKKAEIEIWLGEYESALKSLTQLMPMYRQGEARSLLQRKIGEIHQQRGDFQTALQCYNNALQQIPKSDTSGKALIYSEQTQAHIHLGDFQVAIEKGEKALSLLDSNKPSRHLMLVYNILAEAYMHNGQTDNAIMILKINADIARKIGDEYELASTLNKLAIVQSMIGQSKKALFQWNECVDLYEHIGDVVSLTKTLNNMADVFAKSGFYSRSWNFHRRSYELMKRIGNVKGVIHSLCNIGELEYLREDFSASITTLEKGLEYARRIGSQHDELELSYQIARVLLALNRLNEATKKVEHCIRIAEELRQESKLGRLLLLKSQIFRESNDLAKAQLFLDQAKEYVKEMSDEMFEIEVELEATRLMLDYDQAQNAHKTIKSTLDKVEKTGYRTAHIRGLTMLAESDIISKTESTEVDSSLAKAKQMAEPMKLSLELKRILHLCGQVSINRGEVMRAYDSYKTAYQHLKAITTSITRKDHQSAFLAKAENQKLLKDIQQLQILLKSRHST